VPPAPPVPMQPELGHIMIGTHTHVLLMQQGSLKQKTQVNAHCMSLYGPGTPEHGATLEDDEVAPPAPPTPEDELLEEATADEEDEEDAATDDEEADDDKLDEDEPEPEDDKLDEELAKLPVVSPPPDPPISSGPVPRAQPQTKSPAAVAMRTNQPSGRSSELCVHLAWAVEAFLDSDRGSFTGIYITPIRPFPLFQ